MRRLHLLCVGALKQPWAVAGGAFYEERLRPHLQLTVTELPDSRERDPERQRQDESARLLQAAAKRGRPMWLLDEHGERLTSPQWSDRLTAIWEAGDEPTLILGGAFGVTDELRQAVDGSLRLSDMTLPHELCRVVFLEQLYRATQIERGTGYHH